MISGGKWAALAAFIMAGTSMVLLFLVLSMFIAFAQDRTLAVLRNRSSAVKRWGGFVLIAAGSWLIVLSVWAEAFSKLFPV